MENAYTTEEFVNFIGNFLFERDVSWFEQEVFAYKNWIFAKLYVFLGGILAGDRKN